MSDYHQTCAMLSEHAQAVKRAGQSFKAHHNILSNRIHILEKRAYELRKSYQPLIEGIESEIEFLKGHRAAGTQPAPERTDPSDLQQAHLHSRFEHLRARVFDGSTLPAGGSVGSIHLSDRDMYKPPIKTLAQLKEEKSQLIKRIIEGSEHLDAIGMATLQRALADKEKAINEHPENEREVSRG